KRCGGIAVVQDPHDAAYPNMPQSALENVSVDYSIPLKDMAKLLERLVAEQAPGPVGIPEGLHREARIAAGGGPGPATGDVRDMGDVRYMCRDCGGPLERIEDEALAARVERYRCMVGHAWSANSLLSATTDDLEGAIWAAIRLFRQRSNLLASHAAQERRLHR